MILFRLILLALGWLSAATLSIAIANPVPRMQVHEPSDPEIDARPMLYFVAKGAPHSCGPNCNEWIAAEGNFDFEAANRLSRFLSVESRKKLTIYFHSPGGYTKSGVDVGKVLRENRMKVGVAQTIPTNCRSTPVADQSCRKLMQSHNQLAARLYTTRGLCNSSCVFAFAGGAVRLPLNGARLGIHSASSRLPTGKRITTSAPHWHNNIIKPHIVNMGVDPTLIDISAKVPPTQLRWLTAQEVAKFGLIPTRPLETTWIFHEFQNIRYSITKSWTRSSRANPDRFLVSVIDFDCQYSTGTRSFLHIWREMDEHEIGHETTIRLTHEGNEIWTSSFRSDPKVRSDYRVVPMHVDILAAASKSTTIEFSEEIDGRVRVAKLSTRGLIAAINAAPKHCSANPEFKADPLPVHRPVRN